MASDPALLNDLMRIEYIGLNWFHHFLEVKKQGGISWKGHLSWSEQSLVHEIINQAKNGNKDRVWSLANSLERSVRKTQDNSKIGDIDFYLARIEAEIGRLDTAHQKLRDATNRFASDHHDLAVILWCLGIVLWKRDPAYRWDAMHQWDACRKEFERLHATGPFGETRSEWYRQRLEEIRLFLDEMRKELSANVAKSASAGASIGAAASVGAVASASSSVAAAVPAQEAIHPPDSKDVKPPAEHVKDPGRKKNDGFLRIYPIRRVATSAGQLKENYIGDAGYIDVAQLVIENVTYRIHSLVSSDRMVNVLDFRRVYALRVHGDSMNAPGPETIQDGDLVLVLPVEVDPFREKLYANRIVITSTNEPGSEETNIKKLVYDRGNILLEYQTTNPIHEPNIPFQKGWKIMGVVLARLTPLEDQEDSPK